MEKKRIAESLLLGVILAFSGGFMDAYSYICRGKVFANAQTGNMLLFGINVFEGKYTQSINYIMPVLMFTLGVILAYVARSRLSRIKGLKWQQLVVLCEIGVFFAVSLFIAG